jgi:hypothetical protein
MSRRAPQSTRRRRNGTAGEQLLELGGLLVESGDELTPAVDHETLAHTAVAVEAYVQRAVHCVLAIATAAGTVRGIAASRAAFDERGGGEP